MNTQQTISRRLKFLRIDAQDQDALRAIGATVRQVAPKALDAIYAQSADTPEYQTFFADSARSQSAKSAQLAHLALISEGRFDDAYAASAERIGKGQAAAGRESGWYIGAYACLLDHMIRAVVADAMKKQSLFARNDGKALSDQLVGLVKAAFLDIDILVSIYRAAGHAERARLEDSRVSAESGRNFATENLAKGLARLAEGDLTTRLDADGFPAEYHQLRNDFNAAAERMHEAMRVIVSNAQGIHSGTDEISKASEDLSRRTEQQAATLEETAAALDQITATVRKTAEGASQASASVGAAKADAEASGEVVRKAVDAMSEIEKSSKEIGQIIGVIDEIAFQTNLLALNAGVEAARAGEAGRGFAVVAQEVRALAQRSAEAAKEIKTLISTSAQQVGEGVALVGKTGQALGRIVVQVGEINGIVGEITASTREQATALNEVNTAVNQMDQVTQQNAAMVEETTAAAHSLAKDTEGLGLLVGRFNIGELRVSAPARSAPQRTVPAMRSTGGRGASAVRKSEPAHEAAGWEEF